MFQTLKPSSSRQLKLQNVAYAKRRRNENIPSVKFYSIENFRRGQYHWLLDLLNKNEQNNRKRKFHSIETWRSSWLIMSAWGDKIIAANKNSMRPQARLHKSDCLRVQRNDWWKQKQQNNRGWTLASKSWIWEWLHRGSRIWLHKTAIVTIIHYNCWVLLPWLNRQH